MNILIIDDEESIRYTFESFLAEEGHTVDVASDYDTAISMLHTRDYDLVFVDIILGGRSGIEVLRAVKAGGFTCPVVMITGAPNMESATEAVRLGAFDYIFKPVTQETLLRITETALRHKAVSDEKEKYRNNLEAIFRSVKDAIITVDRDMNVVEINDAAHNICGITRDALGKDLRSFPTGCRKTCIGALTETIDTKLGIDSYRIECLHSDRGESVVTISTSPLLDSHGIFSGAVIVVKDETRIADLERDLRERHQFHNIIGGSETMQEIYSLIESLADVQTTVLITGESGTGKELVAEALHHKGSRSGGPLVKVNCSALSENLLESELFGHVKGAFTGALKDRVGRFQMADGGTIFLDEIGDVSPRLQLNMLRVLQNMEFERVGDSMPVKVDVRVIAATNQSLQEKVAKGDFREDLYYRLKVVEIKLPPLRERLEEIPLLVGHFIKKFGKKFGKEITGVSSDVQRTFINYGWPGNIRELEHTIEHAFIVCRGSTITIEHLPPNIRDASADAAGEGATCETDETADIIKALEKTGWNKARAARMLNIDRKTLYRKIEKYHILKDLPD